MNSERAEERQLGAHALSPSRALSSRARRCRRVPGSCRSLAPQPWTTVDRRSAARQLAGSMPGRAAHQEAAAAAGGTEPTAAGGSAGAAAQQEQRGLAGTFPLVLKKLMENPPRDARLD